MLIVAFFSNLLRALLLPLHALRRSKASPKGGYIVLDVDGPVVDFAPREPLLAFLRRRRLASGRIVLTKVRELARAIAHDPRVTGVLVRIRHVGAGAAMLASFRDALSGVRASGKDVIAYIPSNADTRALYLASAARQVIVGSQTMVAPLGYAVEGRYVRRALERVGLEPEVFAKGAYKSAGEMLLRDTMSEPQREQLGAILEAHHEALVTALSQGRRVGRDVAKRWIDDAPHTAKQAVELGIVDVIAYEDELPNHFLPVAVSAPGSKHRVRTVAADRYLRMRSALTFRRIPARPVIAVIEIHGAIVSRADVELAPLASEERIVAALRLARASSAVRGVVLHIDSPGGSASASDRIHHEVMRLAQEKPVVACLANVAASGGYYVASGAHKIVAQPQTITGSIGVISARLVVGPFLERLGVFTDVVKRGARADLLSASRHLDSGERASIERELDACYQAFLEAVAKGRGRSVAEIAELAEGRVYSGTEAHARKLVDHLGGLDRALHEVRELLGAVGPRLEPLMLRARRILPPPPLLPSASVAASADMLLESIGLGGLFMAGATLLHLRGDRVLAYAPDVATLVR